MPEISWSKKLTSDPPPPSCNGQLSVGLQQARETPELTSITRWIFFFYSPSELSLISNIQPLLYNPDQHIWTSLHQHQLTLLSPNGCHKVPWGMSRPPDVDPKPEAVWLTLLSPDVWSRTFSFLTGLFFFWVPVGPVWFWGENLSADFSLSPGLQRSDEGGSSQPTGASSSTLLKVSFLLGVFSHLQAAGCVILSCGVPPVFTQILNLSHVKCEDICVELWI